MRRPSILGTHRALEEEPASVDPRQRAHRFQQRQRWRWATFLGALLVLLSFFSAGFFLYAVLVVGGLWIVAAVWATASLQGLEVRRTVKGTELALGEATEVTLELANRKSLPSLWLSWREQVEVGLDREGPGSCFRNLAPGQVASLSYRLHSTRRGFFRVGPAIIEAAGPFGLVRRFLIDHEARFVTVLPRVVEIGQGWPLGHRPIHQVPRRRSLFEDPSRFQGVRDYRPGDGLRHVHWRATARARRLQVKVYEPAVFTGVLLALEAGQAAYPRGARSRDAHARDIFDPRLELAITTAASVAQFVLAGDQEVALISNGGDAADRYPGDWTGGSFRRLDEVLAETASRRRIDAPRPLEVVPGKGVWQGDLLRAALARLVLSSSRISLPEMLLAELPRLPRSAVVMIITPLIDEALVSAVEALRRSSLEVGVVWIGDPGSPAEVGEMVEIAGAPIYAVGDDHDLERLGGRRL